MWEAAEDSEDLFPFPGGAEWNRNDLDGTMEGVLPLLDFLSVPLCEEALTPEELLHPLGRGIAAHAMCWGVGMGSVLLEKQSPVPAGGDCSELGTRATW